MNLIPRFYDAALSGNQLTISDPLFTVNSMTWSVIGGCETASITAEDPSDANLWRLVERLRYPVVIMDGIDRNAWWGYVSEVRIKAGGFEFGVSIDSMSNKIAVAYSFIATGSSQVGTRKTTAWLIDADSTAAYGIKEYLASGSGLTDAAALAKRDSILAAKKYPGGTIVEARSNGNATATINCRGWWSTLDWRYAAVAAGANLISTAQIANLVATFGQFMTATDVDVASSVSVAPYLSGDTTTGREIEALLAQGGANSRRLLSEVNINRRVHIYEEPVNTPTYNMLRSGDITTTTGTLVVEYQPPVGSWARLVDVVYAGADTSRMVDPTLQFIEGAAWNSTGGLTPKFRGQLSLSDLMGGGM